MKFNYNWLIKQLNFTIVYKEEPEGGYTVTVPSLPGCVTYGKDLKEAKKMAKDAIQLYVESLKEHGEEIPSDDSIFLSTVNIDPSLLGYA